GVSDPDSRRMSREHWATARAVAEGQDWLLTAEQAKQCGLTAGEISAALRRCEIRLLLRSVYLFDPDLYAALPRRVAYRAALMAEGPGACLVGVSAARMWALQGLPADETEIHVAMVGGCSRRPRRGVRGDESAMPPVVVRQLP